jgi:hypothetical protein
VLPASPDVLPEAAAVGGALLDDLVAVVVEEYLVLGQDVLVALLGPDLLHGPGGHPAEGVAADADRHPVAVGVVARDDEDALELVLLVVGVGPGGVGPGVAGLAGEVAVGVVYQVAGQQGVGRSDLGDLVQGVGRVGDRRQRQAAEGAGRRQAVAYPVQDVEDVVLSKQAGRNRVRYRMSAYRADLALDSPP